MDEYATDPVDHESLQVDDFPDRFAEGATVLVASAGDPSRYAIGLRALCAYGTADETAIVVTTTESVDRTIETLENLCGDANRPSLGVVDTTSEGQSISALYGETPVVFVPAPGDLERLVLALSDLAGNTVSPHGTRHFVVRSLTPILETTATARVCSVLERTMGLRSRTGLGLLGIDYTAHDEATMDAVAEQVDGVLWVTRPSADRIAFDYRPTRGHHDHSMPGGPIEE